MAVIRVEKNKNYTCMSNYHLRDKSLSLKAKGLMSIILSLPDDWNYSVAGLTSLVQEGETVIKSALTELKKYGYLTVKKLMPQQTKSGRIEYEYIIHEQPIEKQEVEKQGVENNPLETTPLKQEPCFNTLETTPYIKYVNPNTDLNTDTNTKSNKRFQKPTLEEVKAYCRERNNRVDPQRFIDFYESKGWMVGKNPMKDWKACVRTWEQSDKQRSTVNNPSKILDERPDSADDYADWYKIELSK